MVPLPMRSYFHSATKKVLDHLRAWYCSQGMQFTRAQVLVQHLVEGLTSALLTMPTVTPIPTQSLVETTTTPFQVEYKTSTQSWLGLASSHLMRWRCFILAEAVSSYDQFFLKCLSKVSLLLLNSFYGPLIPAISELAHHTLGIAVW